MSTCAVWGVSFRRRRRFSPWVGQTGGAGWRWGGGGGKGGGGGAGNPRRRPHLAGGRLDGLFREEHALVHGVLERAPVAPLHDNVRLLRARAHG